MTACLKRVASVSNRWLNVKSKGDERLSDNICADLEPSITLLNRIQRQSFGSRRDPQGETDCCKADQPLKPVGIYQCVDLAIYETY